MLRIIELTLIVWAEAARRSGLVIALAFVLAAVVSGYYVVGHLRVNTDTSAMLDPDLPFQQRAAELKEAFPQIKTDVIIIAQAPSLDEADAFAAALRKRLSERPDLITAVFSPAEEPFFRENGLLYLSESELEARLTQMTKAAGLIETLVKSPTLDTLFATLADNDKLAEKSELGVEILGDLYAELGDVLEASLAGRTRPFSWMGALDTEDPPEKGYLRLVYATPVLDFSRLQPAKPAIEAIRAEIASLDEQFDGRVEAYITGDPALRAEELESVTTGIGLSFLLSFVLVTLLLLLTYRSLFMAALTMTALVITIVLTSAFAAAVIGELNLVSVAFTVLLVGLGLDFAIHLLLHVQEHRSVGHSIRRSLRAAMHEVGAAMALAAPTTALAFFSFVPTEFDGIAQLGVVAGAGVLIAFFVSITFLPAALSALPTPPARPSSGRVRKAFDFLSRISGPVAAVTVMLGAVAIIVLPGIRFDADPMSLRNPDSQSVRGFYLLFDDPETVPYRLTRLVDSEEAARETAETVSHIKTVRSSRSLPDFVPEDQDAKLELIDFAAGSLVFALSATPDPEPGPPTGDGVATLLARLKEAHPDGPGKRLAGLLDDLQSRDDPAMLTRVEENIFAFWPQLVDRLDDQLNADFIDIAALPEVLKERYLSEDGKWRVDILPTDDLRDAAALEQFVTSVEELYPDVGGGALQSKKAGEVISLAMLEATGIALAVIAVFLWLLVRRAVAILLMLFPLALAAVLTAATGVLIDVPFNYANVIVLPLLMGIGVDSGIHLVMRQRQIVAGEEVFGTSTPRAVLFSALTTVASFGSLMLSPHRGTASMGELLSIAIAFTLICTLVVLPVAFRYGEKHMGGFLKVK
ncbi:MAG: MMPL family transporter [Parvularculaceae bacterium]